MPDVISLPEVGAMRPGLTDRLWARVALRDDVRPGDLRFGRHVVVPSARLLLLEGERVEIGDRAFDLLIVLLRARGSIVSKRTLLDQVWSGAHVAEGSLRFQITMLRRALGAAGDAIRSVSGRGYLFAEVAEPPRAFAAIPSAGDDRPDGRADPRRPDIGQVDQEALLSYLASIGFPLDAFAARPGQDIAFPRL